MSFCFSTADILLPDFKRIDGERYAVIACDQYTSEGDYWDAVARTVGDAPSTLQFVLPEIYLENDRDARTEKIRIAMREALDSGLLTLHSDTLVYLERTCRDGKVRCGIVGKIDLECYDYAKGTAPMIRATEGTVLERIPPRMAVRREALFELPHVMLLYADHENAILAPLAQEVKRETPLYDFDLMMGGGHVRGYAVRGAAAKALLSRMEQTLDPTFPFAVGDGNHSLASAKAHYEEIKHRIGAEKAKTHPARYALVEAVNLCAEALVFEPIYRVVFDAPDTLEHDLAAYLESVSQEDANAANGGGSIVCVRGDARKTLTFTHGSHSLTVGTLQKFLDAYLPAHKAARIDYIHGEDSLTALSKKPRAVGFLFDGMKKDALFAAVRADGVLPRKTFSMGEAYDKRYYLEARSITE